MSDVIKNRKLYYAISAIIIVAGLVCAFVFGAGDGEFVGTQRLVAPFSEEFDATDDEVADIERIANEAVGDAAAARVLTVYSGTGRTLELTFKPNAQPDSAAVAAAVNAAYPQAELGEFTASKLAPSKYINSALVVLACFALAWLAAWAAAVFAVGARDSLIALLAVVHDTLLTSAIYVIARAGGIKELIACGLTAAAASAYFNTVKLGAARAGLSANKDREKTVAAAGSQLAASGVTFAAFAAALCLGVIITSVCMGQTTAIPPAILMFFALAAGVYSSNFITPSIWAVSNK